jgi:hypothetical protein
MAARATIAHNTQFDAGDTAWEVALPEDNVQKSLWKRKFFQDTKRTITDISEELKRYNPSSIADAFKMLFSQDKENNFHSRYNQELCWFITDKESVEAQLKEKQIFARTGFVFADATDRTINYQENSGKINADIASKLDAHSNPIIEQLLDGASVDLPYKGEWVLHNPERKSKDDSVLV